MEHTRCCSCRFTGRLTLQYRSMCRCWRLLVACVGTCFTSRVVKHEEEFKCQSVKELVGVRFYLLGLLKCLLALNAFFIKKN
jgi:hypothetical protein